MAYTERYANFDLATGSDNGTDETNAWKTLASMIAGCAAGDRINLKRQASALNITTNQTLQPTVAATAANPMAIRAYTSTIGDGGIWDATITTGGTVTITFGAYVKSEGLRIVGSGSVNLAHYTGAVSSEFVRCHFDTTSSSSLQVGGNVSISRADKCKFVVGRGRLSVIGGNSGNAWIRNSYIQRLGNLSVSGMLINSDNYDRAFALENCHIIGTALAEEGVFIDRQGDLGRLFITGNRLYGFENGIEIDEEPNADKDWGGITNNVFSTMTGYAINRNNTQLGYIRVAENLYHSCSSGLSDYDNFTVEENNLSLSASPFTNASAGDLSFNDTANGGAVCRARGFRMQDEYDWSNLTYKATPNVAIINTRRNTLIGR